MSLRDVESYCIVVTGKRVGNRRAEKYLDEEQVFGSIMPFGG